MATLMGVVSQVVGEVFAVAGDGTRRPLVEGDRVYAGEQLVTGAGGAVAISLANGDVLTLGRDSNLNLSEQMLAAGGERTGAPQAQDAVAPTDADLTDVERLQAAIEAGVDPTVAGEATAAGPGVGAGGTGGAGSGHGFVLLGEVGGALDPVIGFPTAGIPGGPLFPDAEPLATDDPEPDFAPLLDVEYLDAVGSLFVGPALVDEEALANGTNPASDAEQASGRIVVNSPDGISSLQIQGFDGVWVDVTNGGTVVGQYGILVVDAAGNWTYTLTANTLDHSNPNATGEADQVGESFPVRVFDLDGDVSPTVLLNVLTNDDGPQLALGGAQVVAQVDEDETIDGITDNDAVTNVATGGPGTLGALVNFGADGPGGFGLSGSPAAIASLQAQGLTSGGSALAYSVAGNVLTASAGGAVIFTLQVGADGSFVFTLVGQLDHPLANGDDNELLPLPIDFSGVLTAVDGDGDSVGAFGAGSFVINVEDDVPQFGAGAGAVAARVHEDALTLGAGAPHQGNLEGGQTVSASGGPGSLTALVNFGADGPGSFGIGGNLASLAVQGLSSGGIALTYSQAGNVLTASAGAQVIFTLTVGADGSWSFVLRGPIDHPLANGVDSEDLPGLGIDFSGILFATDGDGDPLAGFPVGSFTIDIEDDVPVLVGGARPVIGGVVHEDVLPGGNPEGGGQTSTLSSATGGSLAGLVSFGADGPGAFGLNGAVGSLLAQGLTSGGAALSYSVSGNVLTASAGGATIFTLTVNASGSWSFSLLGPLDHPLADGNDGERLPGLGIDFSGVLTATDGDGDPLAGGFPAGSFVINVEDDVPVLAGRGEGFVPVGGTVHEDALSAGNAEGGQTASISGPAGALFGLVAFGGDGPGAFGLSSDVSSLVLQALTSGGTALGYSVSGNVLTASAGGVSVFTLTVGANGSYAFQLLGPIDHPLADGNDGEFLPGLGIDFSGVLTATDGDGDPLAGGFPVGSFVINVEDDVPVVAEQGEGFVPVGGTVHEDALGTGNAEGGQTTSISGPAGALSGLVAFGGDGPGVFGLSSDVSSLVLQALTSGGVGLSYSVSGNVLAATAGGAPIFTLTVNADGGYVFQLQGPLDHPLADGNDGELLPGLGIDFSGVLTATDGDGDPLVGGIPAGSFVINVEDDVPVVAEQGEGFVPVGGTVHEDALSAGNAEGGQTTSISGPAGALSGLVAFGGDGPGVFGLSSDVSSLVLQALTSGGVGLSYSVSGNVLTATAGDSLIFTLTVGADGSYAFELQGPIDHPLADGNDGELLPGLGIDFSGVLTATDGDGDPLSGGIPAGSFVINVEDDVPVVAEQGEGFVPVGGTVHEDALSAGNPESGQTTSASGPAGALSGLVAFGGDGPGAFGLSSDVSSLVLQALTSGGTALGYSVSGNVLTATVGGAPIFTLTVGTDGSYAFELLGPLDHPLADGNDGELLPGLGIDFSGVLTATDGDGDPLVGGFPVGSFVINVEDDVPVIAEQGEGFVPVGGTVHEDALSTGNPESGQTTSASGPAGALSGLVAFGSDGPGAFGLSSDVSSLQLQGLTSGGTALSYSVSGNVLTATAGGTPIFTLTVGADGSYAFELQGPVDHPIHDGTLDSELLPGLGIDFSGVLTATDGDGDPLVGSIPAGSFVINVEDDVPVIDLLPDGAPPSVEEGATYSGSWTGSHGGDGPGTIKVVVDGGEYDLDTDISLPTGTLHVGSDGSWSFQASAELDQGAAGSQTFSIQITDNDGDSLSDSITLAIIDAAVPVGGQARNAVDEDGLSGGISGGPNDLPDNETVVTGNLGYNFGPDGAATTGAFTWNTTGLSGLGLTSGGVALAYGVSPDGLVLTATAGSVTVFTVEVTNVGTGDYRFTLSAPLDHEAPATPGTSDENDITVDFIYTLQDGDGSTTNGGLSITVDDDSPTIQAGDLSFSSFVTFHGTSANFANSYGYYTKAADGTPLSGKVIWANVHHQAVGDTFDLAGLDPASTGFFIIPHGGANAVLANGTDITFQFVGGKWQAVAGGTPLTGADGANILFSDATLNPGGSHLQDTSAPGNQNWEDKTDTSDYDYNDVNTNVTWGASLQVDESDFGVDATADFSGLFHAQAGADGLQGPIAYSLSVVNPVSGLVDTLTGEAIVLVMNGSVLEGRTEISDELVFSLSVDAGGTVTLDQDRSVVHPTSDPDEVVALGSNLVSLTATVTDGDGDQSSVSVDIGPGISFRDDAPEAADDVLGEVSRGAHEVTIGTVDDLLDNDHYGADGASATSPIQIVGAGSQGGTVVIDVDGNLIYTAAPGALAGTETFTYSIVDGDGDSATATFEITLTGKDPEGGQASNAVDEDGLPQGLAGGPNDLPGQAVSVSGTLGYSVDTFGQFAWNGTAPSGLTSGGSAVSYHLSNGDRTLTAMVGGAGGEAVFILELTDTATGAYTFELFKPLDHEPPASGSDENDLPLSFGYQVWDADPSAAPASGSLTVTVDDDSPAAANDIAKSAPEPTGVNTNLMIILDVSGSMDNNPGVSGFTTRLALAKSAIQNLVDAYDGLGDVMVRLVAFNASATSNLSGSGEIWLTASQAKSVIGALSNTYGDGNTNYDAALIRAISAFDSSGKISGGNVQNVSYFLSDGQPTTSSSWGIGAGSNNGIVAAEETVWTNFLNNNEIKSYALGMGQGTAGDLAQLNPVAYDGIGTGTNTNGILVTNLSQLDATLQGTVSAPTITGNLLAEGANGFGADGPADLPVVSIQHGAKTYDASSPEYDGATHKLVFTTAEGGSFSINLQTGEYSYSLNKDVADDLTETFVYTLVDADGDGVSATLSLTTTDSSEVYAYDNHGSASVEETMVTPPPGSEVLANFSTTSNSTSSPNPWIFDTEGSGVTVSTLADVMTAADDRWGVSAIAGSTNANGVRVQGTALQLIDTSSNGGISSKVATPTFEIAAGETGSVSFQLGSINNHATNDQFNWVLYRQDGASWTLVDSGSHGTSGATTVTTDSFGEGVYRLFFEANDRTNNSNSYRIRVDNITLTTIAAAIPTIEVTAVSGNVLADPNTWSSSSDPLGAVDDKGSEGAVLSIWNGTAYVEVGIGTSVAGDWGSLLINKDGSYTYTPNPTLDGVGQEDVFSYKLTQPDGDSDTAQLVIGLESTGTTLRAMVVADAGPQDQPVVDDDGEPQAPAGDETLVALVAEDDPALSTAPLEQEEDQVLLAEQGADNPVADHLSFAVNGVTSDVLDLSQLLTGLSDSPDGDELSSYLTFSFSASATTISVDKNGAEGGSSVDMSVVVDGIDLSSAAYYSSTDAATVINGLLDDHSLKVA
ncbi:MULTISPECIES: retention module-containing protein [unclassified Pseudomonas]|uniref:retention module-containing protein n=1 Tax=unclassified Pseudomonas TaxID=196821 RepID=UPI002446C3B3|nr:MULTISPECIES: retention module-containing protein [unclassified Pseudomonas]MDG9929661.1 retention module-containing protein [Pseudomonas sp. GD04042]MDH0483436.1 retention module-containing protein [Pseudomonas sp. GD04015]MDH0604761.1 retention module-containing protein [Pseudomonas sp. GD03869]